MTRDKFRGMASMILLRKNPPDRDFVTKGTHEATFRQVLLQDNMERVASLGALAIPVFGPVGIVANPKTWRGKLGEDWTRFVDALRFTVEVVIPRPLLQSHDERTIGQPAGSRGALFPRPFCVETESPA